MIAIFVAECCILYRLFPWFVHNWFGINVARNRLAQVRSLHFLLLCLVCYRWVRCWLWLLDDIPSFWMLESVALIYLTQKSQVLYEYSRVYLKQHHNFILTRIWEPLQRLSDPNYCTSVAVDKSEKQERSS